MKRIILPLVALLACGSFAAAEEGKHQEENHQAPAAQVETAKATGTVTAVNPEKKSFTLKEDGSGDTNDYRAYFNDKKQAPRLEAIAKLKVGDHITITYTEHEGRRVISIEEAKK